MARWLFFWLTASPRWSAPDEQIVRAASLAMGLTTWFVILPLCVASLITGLAQSLGTAWGVLRHYWILFKLLLTSVATIVLLLKLEAISHLTSVASSSAPVRADIVGLQTSLTIHAAGGLLILITATALAVYKPRGMTRYGMRRLREQSAAPVAGDRESESATKMPRWVKIFWLLIIVLVLVVGVMILGGRHGPRAHVSDTDRTSHLDSALGARFKFDV